MAPNTGLEWVKLEKFGGLWDNGAPVQMPSHMAQVMSGCHPQPAGGLRAFFRPIPLGVSDGFTNSGTTGGATPEARPFRIVSVHALGFDNVACVTADVFTGSSWPDAYERVARPGTHNAQAYILTPVGSPAVYQWAAITAGFSGQQIKEAGYSTLLSETVQMAPVTGPDDGTVPTSYVALGDLSTDPQVYSLTSVGGYTAKDPPSTTASVGAALARHQNRLVVAYGRSILFTSPGVYDLPAVPDATNVGFISFSGSAVAWILSVPPADMLVGTVDGAIFNIQGPLDDPVIRTVAAPGASRASRARAVMSPKGVVSISLGGPRYVGLDGQVVPIGSALSDRHWSIQSPSAIRDKRPGVVPSVQPPFDLAQSNGYVFARSDMLVQNKLYPIFENYMSAQVAGINAWATENILKLNGSLVYDTETSSWFRSAHPDVADIFAPCLHADFYSDVEGVITIPSQEFDPAVTTDTTGWVQAAFGQRASVYEWTSAPFHSKDGRQVELAEIQIGVHGNETLFEGTWASRMTSQIDATPPDLAVNPVTSTLTITARNEHGEAPTGGPITVNVPGEASQVLTIPLRLKGTYVDVTVKAAAPHPDVEAPTIEYISFGFTRGASIRKVTVV